MSETDSSKTHKLLQRTVVIFWDFDGVIKDSVGIKSLGYEQLFLPYGAAVASLVREHHETHGGMSRYDKVPLYLSWAGEPSTPAQVTDFCNRFSQLVLRAVIDSDWVAGVPEYLRANHDRQYFVLVTATPQEEIEQILGSLDIADCFREVHGAPQPKAVAIKGVLQRLQCEPHKALMVGDSDSDLNAAQANDVAFLLRRTTLNQALQDRFSGPMFDNLNNE